MPNPLAIVLHASAAETASGASAQVEVGARTYSEIQVDVTAIASSTLSVIIESSPTLSSWTPQVYVNAITSVGARPVIVPNGDKYLRARWTLNGTSATFAVTGTSHQLYVLPKDLTDIGLPSTALANMTPAEIAKACLTASSEAEGYLATANTLPITSLDPATKLHIARMAVFELFRYRPGGAASQYEVGADLALKWLASIATGRVRPPGLVDATPDVEEAGATAGTAMYVVSNTTRGW